jgi:hypothetical protein
MMMNDDDDGWQCIIILLEINTTNDEVINEDHDSGAVPDNSCFLYKHYFLLIGC